MASAAERARGHLGRAPAQVQAFRGPLGERLVGARPHRRCIALHPDPDPVARGGARRLQTTVDEFTGDDRLLRLRWPCPVPGALPVSEVGDAVIGRGFGLMHATASERRRLRAASVDAGQSGVRLVRPVVGGADSRRRAAVRAVSVAEVVAPTESVSNALARELMVALVRAGVTATCSSADKPRYGDLAVDSNLPDDADRARRTRRECRSPQRFWPMRSRCTPRS